MHRPRLPVIFYFLILRSAEGPRRGTSTKCVNEYVATVRDHLRTTLQEAQGQSAAEVHRQKWYYDLKIGAIGVKPGNLILLKADAFQWKRKIRLQDKPYEVACQMVTNVPSYEVKDLHRNVHILHHNWLLLITSEAGIPLCMHVHKVWDRCTPHPSQTYSHREWQQDNTTSRWSGNHPVSG